MRFDEYNQLERGNTARLVAVLLGIFSPFLGEITSRRMWQSLLAVVYPEVEASRYRSGQYARAYYDSERERYLAEQELRRVLREGEQYRSGVVNRRPDLDEPVRPAQRHPVTLTPYSPDEFEESLERARERFSAPEATDTDLARVVAIGAKEALNGGRRTVVRASESDPLRPRWARVAGGGESCAFCTMLISRGPVYLSEVSGSQSFRDGQMQAYHANCDCRVVAVFNQNGDWEGKEAYRDAWQLWRDYAQGRSAQEALRAYRRELDRRDRQRYRDLRRGTPLPSAA